MSYLAQVTPDVLQQFCTIALEFIRKGAKNRKIFVTAAKKLGVKSDVVENAVSGLCFLFTEAAKYLLSEIDFLDSLVVLGFPKEHNEILKRFYIENRTEIRRLLVNLTFELPHYADLDWRLDLQLSSRCMHEQLQPLYILKLDTIEGKERKVVYLQTDYTNLKHLCSELEAALDELKAPYVRRVERNL